MKAMLLRGFPFCDGNTSPLPVPRHRASSNIASARRDKGKVEGMVGYVRRNFLVPIPSFESFEALNAHLERRCLTRMDARLRGHTESIGQRMERDLEALLPLPAAPYDARAKTVAMASFSP